MIQLVSSSWAKKMIILRLKSGVWGCSMICSYVSSIGWCCVTICCMELFMWLGLKFGGFVIAKYQKFRETYDNG